MALLTHYGMVAAGLMFLVEFLSIQSRASIRWDALHTFIRSPRGRRGRRGDWRFQSRGLACGGNSGGAWRQYARTKADARPCSTIARAVTNWLASVTEDVAWYEGMGGGSSSLCVSARVGLFCVALVGFCRSGARRSAVFQD